MIISISLISVCVGGALLGAGLVGGGVGVGGGNGDGFILCGKNYRVTYSVTGYTEHRERYSPRQIIG